MHKVSLSELKEQLERLEDEYGGHLDIVVTDGSRDRAIESVWADVRPQEEVLEVVLELGADV
jgi:hypothetical protein